MIYSILVMGSVTYALKAQGILARQGIGTRLEKLNKNRSLKGCGYGLRIERNKLDLAERLLAEENIRIVEIIRY